MTSFAVENYHIQFADYHQLNINGIYNFFLIIKFKSAIHVWNYLRPNDAIIAIRDDLKENSSMLWLVQNAIELTKIQQKSAHKIIY